MNDGENDHLSILIYPWIVGLLTIYLTMNILPFACWLNRTLKYFIIFAHWYQLECCKNYIRIRLTKLLNYELSINLIYTLKPGFSVWYEYEMFIYNCIIYLI